MFNWFGKKNPKETVVENKSPSGRDWMKSIREREAAEKKRMEKWKKQLNTKNTYPYAGGAVSSGTYSNSYTINSNTITTSLADAKIRIDGGENGTMQVDVPLIVHGRDVMKELDEMREALLLLKRNVDMEAKYPELKEAYDNYMEMYRGLQVAEKFYDIGNDK